VNKNNIGYFWTVVIWLVVLITTVISIRLVGDYLKWSWSDFWLNLISNAASTALIGYVLYWIITRPDEKKAGQKRRDQALAMLKNEFVIDLARARRYGVALKDPNIDIGTLYPLRFTRGAWNSLREGGFLPQLEDVSFVYELLRINEIITVANNSFSNMRRSDAEGNRNKLNKYAKKAETECMLIENHLVPILAKLEKMSLPEIILTDIYVEDEVIDSDDKTDDEGKD